MKKPIIALTRFSVPFLLTFAALLSLNVSAQFSPSNPIQVNGCGLGDLSAAGASPAPANVPAPNCASNTGGADVIWFSLVTTGPMTLTASGGGLPGALTDVGMAVYTFNGSAYNLVDCDDDTGTGLYPLIDITLPAGTTIFVSIWDYGNNNDGPFVFQTSTCNNPTVYYPDNDGDGFGDDNNPQCSCGGTPPANSVTTGGDCDDACDVIYPNAPCNDANPATVGETIQANCSCGVPAASPCIGPQTLTFQVVGSGNPPATNTNGLAVGDNVQICYSLDYTQSSGDWLDGFAIDLGSGWANPTPVATQFPQECNGGPGDWIWQTSINPTGGSAIPAGYGYYYDYNNNGNGGDDWGDAGSCLMDFCFQTTLLSLTNVNVTITAGGDSQFGSFGSTFGCPTEPFVYTPPTTGGCNLALFGCIVPSPCDEDDATPLQNGYHTITGTLYFSGAGLGNLIVSSVNDATGGSTQLMSIPAPGASPYNFTIPAFSDGDSHTVQFYFSSNPACVATGTYQSPDPCGCLLNATVTAFTCQPMPPTGTDPVFYDISLDINDANLPFGTALDISYECGGGNVVNINSIADINTLNSSTYNFGIFGPINALAPGTNSDGFCDITFTLTDITTGAIIPCMFPDPGVQVEVPMVDVQNFMEIPNSCEVTSTGPTNDVQFDLELLGAATINATGVYFFMDGAPVNVNIAGNPNGASANWLPIASVPASGIIPVTVMDVPAVDHEFTFSFITGGCTYNSPVVSAADPAIPYVGSFEYLNPTQCACSITDFTVTNISECLGYSNYFVMDLEMTINNNPAGATFNMSFSPVPNGGNQALSPATPVVPTNGTITIPNITVQVPPTAGGLTQAYTATILAEFNNVITPCQATVDFVVPGDCGCNPNAGTFTTSIASTSVAGNNQIAICTPGASLNWNSNDNFTPPSVAYETDAANNPVMKPHQRGLGLVFYDLNDPTQQVLWSVEDFDFTAATPTINDLTFTYDAAFTSANQIVNLLNLPVVVGDEPVIFGARIITVYNPGALGTLPTNISGYYDATIDSYLPPLFETGFGPSFNPLVSDPCGAISAEWTIVLPPPITTAQVGQDCLNGLMIFQAESGNYPFNWTIVNDNPANALLNNAQSNLANDATTTYNGNNYSGGFFTYGNMVTGNVLNVNIQDTYGCTANFTSTPFVGPTEGVVGQIINGVTSPAATVPGQIVQCASNNVADQLQFTGLGVGLGNVAIPGTWNLSWNGNLLTTPLTAYFDDATGLFTPSYDLINSNPGVAPYANNLQVSFTPNIPAPGCSIESDYIQIAVLDDYFPTTTGNLSKCTNSAMINLTTNGSPAGGQWHAGTYDPATDTYSNDNGVIGLNNVNPTILGAGNYDLWYDIANAPNVQCGKVSQIPVPLVVHDTTNAVVTVVDPDGCTPYVFDMSNASVSAGTNTNCRWFVNGTEDVNGDCSGFSPELSAPGLYDIRLIIQDENGCIDTTSYNNLLEVFPLPEVSFYSTPSSVTMDNPLFQFINNSASPLAQWDWDYAGYGTGAGQITTFNFSAVTEPGTYEVCLQGTDLNGCINEFCNNVVIKEGFAVYMPSAITADQDNLNEALRPVISGYERVTVYLFRIFDRWGNVIFETNDLNEYWNANSNTLKDYYVNSGVYHWTMEVTLEGLDDTQLFKGSVTVIR